jgi:hypothetical protein
MSAHLPAVISRYLAAHDRHATDETLATLTPNARVVDDGHEHVGTTAVRTWLDTTAAAFIYTRTLLDAVDEGDGAWLVVNRIEGDFPGGRVDLRYRFVLDGDLIAELVIAP